MTVEKILKDIDFWKSQERNGHSFDEMSQAVEALKESVRTTLTLYASQVREERDREILEALKTQAQQCFPEELEGARMSYNRLDLETITRVIKSLGIGWYDEGKIDRALTPKT